MNEGCPLDSLTRYDQVLSTALVMAYLLAPRNAYGDTISKEAENAAAFCLAELDRVREEMREQEIDAQRCAMDTRP